MKIRMSLILGWMLVMLVSTVAAQDTITPCEQALADAETAFADTDYETALASTETAETLCADDVFLFRDVVNLQARIKAAQDQQSTTDTLAAARPGLVDIGEYSIFMTCEGVGSPTIIFENGLGWNVDTWNDVYPSIAEETQVCRYDRLGVGYSDTVPNQTPRTSLEQSVDLHQVLEIAEIEPPYVLVGHSIAGYMLVSFTHLYPDDVVGVVFVDASIPENIQGAIPNATVRGSERLDVPASYQALQDAEAGDMDEIPVVVLTSMHRFDEYQTQNWIREQAQWHASRSPNTQHILAEESGHYIQNDEPDLVIDSIFWVFNQVVEESSPE